MLDSNNNLRAGFLCYSVLLHKHKVQDITCPPAPIQYSTNHCAQETVLSLLKQD